MAQHVNVDNFARAETNRMFGAIAADSGGVNRWMHNRLPTPIDHQVVIRSNRDTLYSATIVDMTEGATLTFPDPGDRYASAMFVDQDHFVTTVIHEPGEHRFEADDFDTEYVLIAIRILVDPPDPDDVAIVNGLQDRFAVDAGSARPFEVPEYDQRSFDATREALLELARGIGDFQGAFGGRDEVDPVRHLIGSAAGWGGLPESEAIYLNLEPRLDVADYQLMVGEVPVDGFWSLSLYNADGYFEANDLDAYSVNNLTAEREADGTVTISFGEVDTGRPNFLPIMEGWNYTVRLYRPRAELRDGSWKFPEIEPVG